MAQPQPRVVLVVGPSGSGKTSLLRRLVDGSFVPSPKPTIGLDAEAGRHKILPDSKDLTPDLAAIIPGNGVDLEFWEIGGRELREAPRGKQIDAVLLCYDATDRTSFHRIPHVWCTYRMDKHSEHALRAESVVKKGVVQKRLPAVLCGTKAERHEVIAVQSEEVEKCVQSNSLQSSVLTCASTGLGVSEVVQALAVVMLRAEAEHQANQAANAAAWGTAGAEAWSLPCEAKGIAAEHQSSGIMGPMTAPRGMRSLEPPRGERGAPTAAPRLVEVIGHGTAAPRTVEQCLEQGLQHRAVHVWLMVPRTGAVLLRKWSPRSLKHPSLWGPTCHGEIQCYGDGGDGHASEMSAQAAVRLLREQLGVDAARIGEFDHWFSVNSEDGNCREIVDVQVAFVDGSSEALPPLHIDTSEEVNWVFFTEVFHEQAQASKVGLTFHMEDEYRASMLRRVRANVVLQDAGFAFGDGLDLSGF